MYKASAPGSLMLLGEHAVLHGHAALCAAIDHRIFVTLETLSDPVIEIKSSLGRYREPIGKLRRDPQFKFILMALGSYQDQLQQGLCLTINAEFSATVGFGSSAAVTVATLHVLAQYLDDDPSPKALAKRAKSIIVAVQGRGSGADAAASSLGGIVRIQNSPELCRMERCPLETFPEITPIYCGYKKATSEVIEIVELHRQKNQAHVDSIFTEMGNSCDGFITALQSNDLVKAGSILNHNFKLQEQLGVSNEDCRKIIAGLQGDPDILGAKISGSGLGDCLVGLGTGDVKIDHYETLTATIAPEGVRFE